MNNNDKCLVTKCSTDQAEQHKHHEKRSKFYLNMLVNTFKIKKRITHKKEERKKVL